ncbi:bifunctional UDP-N-acetylglucosamine diphosphorylase/glucosamine-1-phosphate N-acetyltransferase GlmU [Caldicellulosiruptor morganii]|uniref:Bifunctional protein GlmU n=1 Tax=Caldicellulosiruptor morganii TaxID=1387555 RepID=A0ABY7BNA0_9FIRM|nr:bifunctional UDP-N-acetylglucosamine diphosphorylase/glucosamine-1-phosphate N-acetyltransferase GlmU [Caldicellulosiruptor morganii]WAM33521.1 bifunctional UDP-N-acetylglucosamine diphosphorylase/glucosamine-1-phosphate N-acetyltransferase GlmU [Caldicellulosiruptor morganii]
MNVRSTFIILAAGEGKRMKSKYSKVVQKVMGKPMILYIIDEIEKNFENAAVVVVVGNKKEDVYKVLEGRNVKFAYQEKQLGTAHAVMCALDQVPDSTEDVFVLYGDAPFIKADTLKRLSQKRIKENAALCLLTAIFDNPYGYGRIIADENGNVLKIVEERDATYQEKKIKEINPGFYCFEKQELVNVLGRINNNNSQNEYYLTDAIEILNRDGKKIVKVTAEDNFEVMGINSRYELFVAEQELKLRINKDHLSNGVQIIDIYNTYIHPDVQIGRDTVIYPGTFILGKTSIGEDCVIGPQTYIVDSKVGNSCHIQFSVIESSKIKDNVKIGPYAHLRPNSHLEEGVKIGNFVEIKNSKLGKNTKSAHLTYIGDADIGENVNLGCGTIFVNYDGYKKHRTVVENNAFIGCNSNLVAPVKIGENAYIAAGSTITEDVPANALAIARQRQTNKEGWVLKRKQMYENR